jgi:hypothetical protein
MIDDHEIRESENMLEMIPPDESQQIQHIVELTLKQLQMRYLGRAQVRRGVHAKDHGCVTATFEVLPDIEENLRQGIFARPGKVFSAIVRFSNAATLVTPDSKFDANGNTPSHGSRGMAIKLLGVEGSMLTPPHGAPTQDFLMINQPVFAFANVEDYEVLSRVLVDNNDKPDMFFKERLSPPTDPAAQLRAKKTLEIVGRIKSASVTANPPAYQQPAASPVDNDYFSASVFAFGPNQVMRFRVVPTFRSPAEPNISDPNYLRTGLVNRLRDKTAGEVVFHFEVRARTNDSIDPEADIENASMDWDDSETSKYMHVATLTIPLQEFDSPEMHLKCERLVFTPWHCLEAHRPLGGINRLRRAVYEASARFRNLPKEPASD